MATLIPTDDTLAPPAIACANCGWSPCGDYCPRCGQETHDLHRSLAGILGEMLDAFAGWDGKIPATFALLLRRPGALTTEFLAGRRVRYLRPLRLYLTTSVLFFLSMSVVHNPRSADVRLGTTRARILAPASTPPNARRAEQADAEFTAFVNRTAGEQGRGPVPYLKHRIKEGLRVVSRLPARQRGPAMQAAFMSKLGNTIFLLMPVFAALLQLLYRRARVYFAEHVVFALHFHAFVMLAMTVAHLISSWAPPRLAVMAALPELWMPAYLFVAMRRVYGGTRRRTAVKFAALAVTYGPILLAATAITALLAVIDLAS